MPIKTIGALKYVRRETKNALDPHPYPVNGALPLTAVHCLEVVFQPRDLLRHQIERDWFLEDLDRALQRSGAAGLDPVLIWWSGRRWMILDGHHRVKAYEAANWGDLPVPVEVFVGTLDEARLEATRRNTKNRLPMRHNERLQAAWRLVCSSDLSKAQIALGTSVAERTVGNMRQRLREVLLLGQGKWTQDALLDEQWRRVNLPDFLSADIETEAVEDVNERTARIWAARLSKHFGMKLLQNPEAFALALSYVSDAYPARLMETEVWQSLGAEPEDIEVIE